MSNIGKLFLAARKKARLKPKDLVLRAGYKKISKGMRHLKTLEDGHELIPNPKLVEKFAAALGINVAAINKAVSLDLQELNSPIQPYLIERMMPAMYRRHKLPEECSVDDAHEIASRLTVETGRSCCLVLSHVRTVYFYPSGKHRESGYVPGTSIGRYKAFLDWSKRVSGVSLPKVES